MRSLDCDVLAIVDNARATLTALLGAAGHEVVLVDLARPRSPTVSTHFVSRCSKVDAATLAHYTTTGTTLAKIGTASQANGDNGTAHVPAAEARLRAIPRSLAPARPDIAYCATTYSRLRFGEKHEVLQPVHTRHSDVHQDDVGPVLEDRLQGLLAVGCLGTTGMPAAPRIIRNPLRTSA